MTFAAREVVSTPDGQHFLVQAMPRGGLTDVTPTSGPATWLTAIPGALGLLGLFLNKVIHRGRWLVVARLIVHGRPTEATWSAEADTIDEANQLAETAMQRLRAGESLIP